MRTIYTPSFARVSKSKIKYFKSPRNKPLIILDYCSKKIEEDFNLHNPGRIYLSDKYTTRDVRNIINIMINHINSMEQGMIGLKGEFIESENYRVNQSIRIYQLIRENISTKKKLQHIFTL